MSDLATLGLAVDSSQVKIATKDLDGFSKSANSAAAAAQKTSDAAGKSKDPVKAFASAFKDADANQGSYGKGANKVIDSLSNQFVRLQSTGRQWAQLSAIQKAGVDVNSDAADKIAKMAGALFDMEQGQKKTAAAANDNVKANRLWAGSSSQVIQALGLFGIGFGTVLTAATELYRYLNRNAPTTEKILQEQDRLIRIVKASYDDATKSAKNFFEQSKDVTRLQLLQQEIELQQKLREEVGKGISNSTTFGNIGDFFSGTKQVKEQFQAFEDAIFRLKDGFDQGAPNVREFADQVARIGLQNPELQKAAIDLIKNVGSASELAEKLKAIRSSLDLLDGKKLNDEGRASIGLRPDRSGENLASAWDKQLASLSRRNAAMEAEARTVGQSDAAHEKMRTTLLLEDFLYNKGIKNIDAYREQIAKAGDEAAKTAEKLARARINDQIGFDRNTAFLTQEDVQIASQLKAIYGNDIPAALSSTEAAAMRAANGMRELSNLGQDVNRGLLVEFGQQLRNGASAWDAFRNAGVNALGKIADKLMSMAADNLWRNAFGGSSGGLLGGLGSLLGFGGSAGSVGVVGAAGGMVVPTFFHDGGLVGSGGTQRGAFPAALFHEAPRYHLGVDEVPAILQRGERVIPRGQNDNRAPSMQFTFAPQVDARGADVAAVARLEVAMARQQRDFERNVQGVMTKYYANTPGAKR
jgi:hypothetical protein